MHKQATKQAALCQQTRKHSSEMKLGDKQSSWAGFEIPSIDLGAGVTINPATVDLDTLEQLANDVASQ